MIQNHHWCNLCYSKISEEILRMERVMLSGDITHTFFAACLVLQIKTTSPRPNDLTTTMSHGLKLPLHGALAPDPKWTPNDGSSISKQLSHQFLGDMDVSNDGNTLSSFLTSPGEKLHTSKARTHSTIKVEFMRPHIRHVMKSFRQKRFSVPPIKELFRKRHRGRRSDEFRHYDGNADSSSIVLYHDDRSSPFDRQFRNFNTSYDSEANRLNQSQANLPKPDLSHNFPYKHFNSSSSKNNQDDNYIPFNISSNFKVNMSRRASQFIDHNKKRVATSTIKSTDSTQRDPWEKIKSYVKRDTALISKSKTGNQPSPSMSVHDCHFKREKKL
ncbi:hypothetical protein PoB_005600000 [Plakobranchus ocellatus]|uniref:Uncharacterized protein n=1 Tax=Plakobranchus ocellatus TaxID=259542 RepID=A0AAV4CCX0_9GAST|nr:hypothetical protein PoB_005600000 [Plakobranchus ocellatus]